jgi:hypothetical protein
MMTLRDLIDELTDLADTHGDDSEIRLAQQPRWAFEYSLQRDTPVAVVKIKEDGRKRFVAYIAEGSQLGYLPYAAAVAIGWAASRDDDDDDDEDVAPEPVKDMDGTYYHAPANDEDEDDDEEVTR